jgi:hypothetical protein
MYAAVQHIQDRPPVQGSGCASGGCVAQACDPARTRASVGPGPATANPGRAWWLGGRDGCVSEAVPMTAIQPRQIFIQGITSQGRAFRPSDWAERLAGAMSCFRPPGSAGGISGAIGYSPLCFPRVIDGVKCVIVSEELRSVEPMAWDFVLNFARDNDLTIVDACALPGPSSGTTDAA